MPNSTEWRDWGTATAMLLALDLGNTSIKCGLFSGARLLHTLRAETRRERTADEHGILLRDLVGLADVAVTTWVGSRAPLLSI